MNSSKRKLSTAKIVAICCLFALCIASVLGVVLPTDNTAKADSDKKVFDLYLSDLLRVTNDSNNSDYAVNGKNCTIIFHNDLPMDVLRYCDSAWRFYPYNDYTAERFGSRNNFTVLPVGGTWQVEMDDSEGDNGIWFRLPWLLSTFRGYEMATWFDCDVLYNDTDQYAKIVFDPDNSYRASIVKCNAGDEGAIAPGETYVCHGDKYSSLQDNELYSQTVEQYYNMGTNITQTSGELYGLRNVDGYDDYYCSYNGQQVILSCRYREYYGISYSYDESTDTLTFEVTDPDMFNDGPKGDPRTENDISSNSYKAKSLIQRVIAHFEGKVAGDNMTVEVPAPEHFLSFVFGEYYHLPEETSSLGTVAITSFRNPNKTEGFKIGEMLQAKVTGYVDEGGNPVSAEDLIYEWSGCYVPAEEGDPNTSSLLQVEIFSNPDTYLGIVPNSVGYQWCSLVVFGDPGDYNSFPGKGQVTLKVYDVVNGEIVFVGSATVDVKGCSLEDDMKDASVSMVVGEERTLAELYGRFGVTDIVICVQFSRVDVPEGGGVAVVNSDLSNFKIRCTNSSAPTTITCVAATTGCHTHGASTTGEMTLTVNPISDPALRTTATCNSITIVDETDKYDYYVGTTKGTKTGNNVVFSGLEAGSLYAIRLVKAGTSCEEIYTYSITTKHIYDACTYVDALQHSKTCSSCHVPVYENHTFDANKVCTECGYVKPAFRLDASFDGTITNVNAAGAQAKLDDDERVRDASAATNNKISSGDEFTVYYYITSTTEDVWEATIYPKYDSSKFAITAINGSTNWEVSYELSEMQAALADNVFAGFSVFNTVADEENATGFDGTGLMFSITYKAKADITQLGRYEFGLDEGKSKIGIGSNDSFGNTYVAQEDIVDAKGTVSALIRITVSPQVYFSTKGIAGEPFVSTGTLSGNAFTYTGRILNHRVSNFPLYERGIYLICSGLDYEFLDEISENYEIKFYEYDDNETDNKGAEIDGSPIDVGNYVVEFVLTGCDKVNDLDIIDVFSIGKAKITQKLTYTVWERNSTGGVSSNYANGVEISRSSPANNDMKSDIYNTTDGEWSFLSCDNHALNFVYDINLADINSALDVKVEWFRFTPQALGANIVPDAKIFLYENGTSKQGIDDHALESTAVEVAPSNGHYYFYNSGLYRITVSLKEDIADNYEWDKTDTSWYNAERNALLNKLTGEEMLNGGELYYYIGISKSKLKYNTVGDVVYNGVAQLQSSASSFIPSSSYTNASMYVPTKYGTNNYADLIDVTKPTSAGDYIDVGNDYSVTVTLKDGSSTVATGEYNATSSANYDDDFNRYFCFADNLGYVQYMPDGLALTMAITPKPVYVSGGTVTQSYAGTKNTSGIVNALSEWTFTDSEGTEIANPLYSRDGISISYESGDAYDENGVITYGTANVGTYELKADITDTDKETGSLGKANYEFIFSSTYEITKIDDTNSIFYVTDKIYDGKTFDEGTGYASDEVTGGQYWAYVGTGVLANNGTVKYYFIVGDVWTEITRETVCNMPFVNAGTYTLGVKITGATNYNDWQSTKEVEITPKAITWTYEYMYYELVDDDMVEVEVQNCASRYCVVTPQGLVGYDTLATLFIADHSIEEICDYFDYYSGASDFEYYVAGFTPSEELSSLPSEFTINSSVINPNYTVAKLQFRKVVALVYEDHSESHPMQGFDEEESVWYSTAKTGECTDHGHTENCEQTYMKMYLFANEDGKLTYNTFFDFGHTNDHLDEVFGLDRYSFVGWRYGDTVFQEDEITISDVKDTYVLTTTWSNLGVRITYKYRYVHQAEATQGMKTYATYQFKVGNETDGYETYEYRTLAVGASTDLVLSFANEHWSNWFVSSGWKDSAGNLVTVAPETDVTLYAEFDFDASRLGDVNGDGLVNGDDVILMRRNSVNYSLSKVLATDYSKLQGFFYSELDYAGIVAVNPRLMFIQRAELDGNTTVDLADTVVIRMALTSGYDYYVEDGGIKGIARVRTFEQLNDALTNGKKVVLAQDITSEGDIELTNEKGAQIDLAGHTLTLGSFSIKATAQNASISIVSSGDNAGTIEIAEGGDFKAEAPLGNVTISNLTVYCGREIKLDATQHSLHFDGDVAFYNVSKAEADTCIQEAIDGWLLQPVSESDIPMIAKGAMMAHLAEVSIPADTRLVIEENANLKIKSVAVIAPTTQTIAESKFDVVVNSSSTPAFTIKATTALVKAIETEKEAIATAQGKDESEIELKLELQVTSTSETVEDLGSVVTIDSTGESSFDYTQYVSTESELVSALTNAGAKIQLTNDVTLTGTLTVSNDVTVDLNGKTITGKNSKRIITVDGATLTVSNGVITGYQNNISEVIIMIAEDSGFIAENVTVTNSYQSRNAIFTNGKSQNCTVSLKNCTINGRCYFPAGGTYTIDGGTYSGRLGAFYFKSGTINISGGSFSAIGCDGDWLHSGGGAYWTGEAVVIEACNYPSGDPTVNITGGTFTVDGEGNEFSVDRGTYTNYGLLVIEYLGNTANMSGTSVQYAKAIVANECTSAPYYHFNADNVELFNTSLDD